jgi:hypothetical protein
MNCFNIRELQGILKRKFFTDLVNTSDSHTLSEPTLINMRHKNNMSNILLYDQSLFYNFDLTNTSKHKSYTFNPGKTYTYLNLNTGVTFGFLRNYNLSFINYYVIMVNTLKDMFSFLYIPNFLNLPLNFINSIFYFDKTLFNALYLNLVPNFDLYSLTNLSKFTSVNSENNLNLTTYNTSTLNYSTLKTLNSSNFSETSSS